MRRLEARIGSLIWFGVAILAGVMFWLAYERHVLLEAIEQEFGRLQQVARTGRVAADVATRLAALSAGIREYAAADSIEPPARIESEARRLIAAVAAAGADLSGTGGGIASLATETERYLASFDAIVAARRLRREHVNRLGQAAGRLRAVADAAGLQQRFFLLREAELNYLIGHHVSQARQVADRLAELAAALRSRSGADAVGEYERAFAGAVEIIGVLDRDTVRLLDEQDARLRDMAGAIGRRAQEGEGSAASGFRATLATAVRRTVEVVAAAVLIAFGGAFLLLRYVVMPVNRLTGTMTAVAGGDYAIEVPYVERKDEIGQMARSLATFRNALLQLKAAQAQAEAASRHKSDFIANMSHELRTPLNAIIGLSDMLLEDADNPDTRELRQSLPRIGAAARHLLSLINEILDLSRIEAGRMSVEISTLKPALLAEESLATVAPIARQKGLQLAAAYPRQLPTIDSDPQRVRQILINLLGNAVKFTESGEVRIEVSATDETVRFAVTDTGPGIAAEDVGRLFQDFTQLDASSTRKFGGSGLGLALSRRLARLIGGDVTLASTVGKGSTFTLDLPLAAPQAGRNGPQVERTETIVAAGPSAAERGGDRA